MVGRVAGRAVVTPPDSPGRATPPGHAPDSGQTTPTAAEPDRDADLPFLRRAVSDLQARLQRATADVASLEGALAVRQNELRAERAERQRADTALKLMTKLRGHALVARFLTFAKLAARFREGAVKVGPGARLISAAVRRPRAALRMLRRLRLRTVADWWTLAGSQSVDFDADYYASHNPDVARSGSNPLVHYQRWGARQGRRPRPRKPLKREARLTAPRAFLRSSRAGAAVRALRTAATRIDAVDLRPQSGRPADDSAPLAGPRVVICCTHVVPCPPRAGNEYRTFRLLRWLAARGYTIVLVVAPLPGETVAPDVIRELGEHFGQVIVCSRDGRVDYLMSRGGAIVRELDGARLAHWSRRLAELGVDGGPGGLVETDRVFCHETAAAVVATLQHRLGRAIVLGQYIFMTRLFPLLDAAALKVVDTIDVFSTRHEKVKRFGVEDLELSPEDERERLLRADLVLAIQPEEHAALQRLVPERRVATVGVDFDVVNLGPAAGSTVLLIASDNPMNVKGLRDFLRLAWPAVRRDVPQAECVVAGRVCGSVATPPPGVRLLGPTNDTTELYRTARVAINPAIAGTGVKIKTLDALRHFRPVVTWPAGVNGLPQALASHCLVVDDWFLFARRVVDVLTDPRPEWFDEGGKVAVRDLLRPESVYQELDQALERWTTSAP